jgi:hypothetical protein
LVAALETCRNCGSEFQSGGEAKGVVENAIGALRLGKGYVVIHLAAGIITEMVGGHPVPVFAFMAEPDTAQVQICIRDDGVEVMIRA